MLHPDPDTKTSVNTFHFDVAPPPGGGNAETEAITRRMRERYSAAASQRHKQLEEIRMAQAKHQQAIIQRVGPAQWQKLQDYTRGQRASEYGLAELAVTPDRSEKYLAGKRAARAEAHSMIKSAGINPGEIKRLHRDFAEQRQHLLRPKRQGTERLELLPASKVPGKVLERMAKRAGGAGASMAKDLNHVFRPAPYDGALWYYDPYVSGGNLVEVSPYLDKTSGSVGMRSEYQNYNASNFDFMDLWVDTAVGFWYKPASSGRLDIWIGATCGKAQSKIYLEDEAGWSDSNVYMDSFITLNVTDGLSDEDRLACWSSIAHGNPDGEWYVRDWFSPGVSRYFHLTTSQAMPGGVWTFIKFGTYDWHTSMLNDVSSSQWMRNRWFFESVDVDIV